jgi:hypothetical protein
MVLINYWIEGDFPFAITKHDKLGSLCGYIGVPSSHPWYGKRYDDISAEVHGGLTFSHHQNWGHPAEIAMLEVKIEEYAKMGPPISDFPRRLLVHEQEHAGEDSEYPTKTGQDIWWFGFDCAHAWDLVPGISGISQKGMYRDEEYVREELRKLAGQAAVVCQILQILEEQAVENI